MADGDKPDVKPTAEGRIQPTLASGAAVGSPPPMPTEPPGVPVSEPAFGTMQLPRGAMPNAPTGGPPPMPDEAAPLMATMMPNTASPLPNVAPPAMPQEGRYTPVSEIARGGMGRVVEATDTVLGRTVAVKEALSLDPETIRRFQRETRITARLEHPSIVPVHDAGIAENGTPFYVMRKVSGRPLEDLVARADTVNKRLALVPHVVAAAQAIAHAHARGIVHRDIKPSNILVGDLGETIVIDWGLAKGIDEAEDERIIQRVIENDDSLKTRAGVVFGTPGFMAPEQLRGKPVDEKCDVYALGATLYHLLARRPPHHHKNAEQMMHAAVEGPPQPLSEIVEGVPPELTTIIDKALAHDAATRYQNAGALAEDLQRFLTGQLVASHYYTPRERIVRFLRKYRAAVGVSIAALVTLAVVATILIVRIVDERDRADEQAQRAMKSQKLAEEEKDKVVKGSRQLVLANARHLATTDPTRAAALVRPLLSSELWREARDVIAAARANGIAFSLPASPHTLSLELSRDGERALAAGDDGIVRIYDLAKREDHVVADTKGAVMARFADGERKIVLFQGNRLTILDTATHSTREITTSTPVAHLEVAGPIAYWTDPANAMWKLDLAGGPPARVDVGEAVRFVSPSPDGRWLALAGVQHLLLLDRSNPSQPPQNITQGDTKNLSWAGDSGHLVVLIDDEIIDVMMDPSPTIFNRITVGARFSVAYSDGRIFSAGPTGVGQVSKDTTRIRAPGPEHTLGVYEGRERVVISAKPQGAIVVLSDNGDHTLVCPTQISSVATSARGPWIVAATDEHLLVWDLDSIEPRSIGKLQPSSAKFVSDDELIATYEDRPAEWLDLRTNKTLQLGDMEGIVAAAPSPDGALSVVIDLTRKAWLVAGLGQPQAIEGEVSAAVFVDNARLVIAGEGGLRLEDQQHHTKLVLFAHGPAARRVVATSEDGGWVAAAFEDGLLWRKHLSDGATTQLQLPATPAAYVAMAPDGDVLVGVGGELRAWRSDGKVDVVASGIKPIVAVSLVEPTVALAVTDEAAAYQISLRGRETLAPPQPIAHSTSFAASLPLAAGLSAIGGVEVYDPLAHWTWPLAVPQKGQAPYSFVDISPDGRRVLAMTATSLLVWTLDLPATAEGTTHWLDKLTNATAESPTEPLGWR